jgi:hypothetical protein
MRTVIEQTVRLPHTLFDVGGLAEVSHRLIVRNRRNYRQMWTFG